MRPQRKKPGLYGGRASGLILRASLGSQGQGFIFCLAWITPKRVFGDLSAEAPAFVTADLCSADPPYGLSKKSLSTPLFKKIVERFNTRITNKRVNAGGQLNLRLTSTAK
jgi:hypothetical protein